MARLCVALDLEFTGLDVTRDQIIEIGAVAFQGRREVGRFQSFVRPTIPLPLQTERLTGIRRADLAQAPRFDEVKGKLLAFIGDAPIVGQSAPRDIEALARQGAAVPNPVFDTFDLASILLPDLPSYTLAAIADRLGVKVGGVHRALADALMTRDVFLALADIAERLDPRTISEIVQLTGMTDWPLKIFFQDIEREQSRRAPATSLAAVLASKGGIDTTNVDFLTRSVDRVAPLVPTDADPELDRLASTLAEGGALARTLPDFEARPEQAAMLEAVGEAFEQGDHLLVEAGTGTGKSLAYLIPAADLARTTNRRVVLATNTITLQDQIVKKDIPLVEAVLAETDRAAGERHPPLRTAVVKGRTNYLCLRRWAEFRKSGMGLTLDEVKVLCRILVWLPATGSGDRAELNLTPGEQAVWTRVSAQADDCLVGTCSFQRKGTCFLYRARRNAESAHLVVVNHALLLSDLASENRILPEYEHLVVDEAHHLEDEATRQFGFTVGRRDIARHLDALSEARARSTFGLLTDLRASLRDSTASTVSRGAVETIAGQVAEDVALARPALDGLFTAVSGYLRATGEETDPRRRLTDDARRSTAWISVADAWDNLHVRLSAIGDGLAKLQGQFGALANARIESYDDLMLELAAQARRNVELRGQLQAIVIAPEMNSVTWIEHGPQQTINLSSAPLEVGGFLRDRLFQDKRSVVLTSATLAADGRFDYARDRLGLDDARELRVGSPFDYEHASLILVPGGDFPEPNKPGHEQAVADLLIRIASATEGRMLALFTSNSALRRARSAMRPVLEKQGIVVLGQNVDGPRGQLLNAFRTNPRTVLLGTASFWEGVDVPGDALSVLAITRLPFGVPTDPVFAARSERIPDSFGSFAVPQAILRFRQGFGRLIRSKRDRGVAVVLDTRIRTKGYGATFRRSLPTAFETVHPKDLPARAASFLADA